MSLSVCVRVWRRWRAGRAGRCLASRYRACRQRSDRAHYWCIPWQAGALSRIKYTADAIQRLQRDNDRDTPEYTVQAFKAGSFSKIAELLRFGAKLAASAQQAAARLDTTVIAIFEASGGGAGGAGGAGGVGRVDDVKGVLAAADALVVRREAAEALMDNRDFSVEVVWCEEGQAAAGVGAGDGEEAGGRRRREQLALLLASLGPCLLAHQLGGVAGTTAEAPGVLLERAEQCARDLGWIAAAATTTTAQAAGRPAGQGEGDCWPEGFPWQVVPSEELDESGGAVGAGMGGLRGAEGFASGFVDGFVSAGEGEVMGYAVELLIWRFGVAMRHLLAGINRAQDQREPAAAAEAAAAIAEASERMRVVAASVQTITLRFVAWLVATAAPPVAGHTLSRVLQASTIWTVRAVTWGGLCVSLWSEALAPVATKGGKSAAATDALAAVRGALRQLRMCLSDVCAGALKAVLSHSLFPPP